MLHRGNLGPARLAATSGAPILPIGLVGTDQVQAPDQRLPRTGKRVAVRFGKPVRLQPQSASSRAQLRDATDEIMADIADLCEQPYNDHYAKLATT
jgi:1-acyl-sn-glycerol-3-phosphate acyltransferase